MRATFKGNYGDNNTGTVTLNGVTNDNSVSKRVYYGRPYGDLPTATNNGTTSGWHKKSYRLGGWALTSYKPQTGSILDSNIKDAIDSNILVEKTGSHNVYAIWVVSGKVVITYKPAALALFGYKTVVGVEDVGTKFSYTTLKLESERTIYIPVYYTNDASKNEIEGVTKERETFIGIPTWIYKITIPADKVVADITIDYKFM